MTEAIALLVAGVLIGFYSVYRYWKKVNNELSR